MASVILFISGSEIVVVMLVVLILFGSKSIPGMARTFGKGMKEFRNVTQELKNELESSTEDFRKDIDNVKNTVQKETKKISEDVKNVSDNVVKKTREVTDEVTKEINTTSEKKQKSDKVISDKTEDENKNESVYGYDMEEPEPEAEAEAEAEDELEQKSVKTSNPKKTTKITQKISEEKVEQEYGSDND